MAEDVFAGDLFVIGDITHDPSEGSRPQWFVRWYDDQVPERRFSAELTEAGVIPVAADVPGKLFASDTARQLHATAMISSFLRCNRT